MLSYFGEYQPVYVEWLDDSSCNVLFGDAFTAKRAIFALGKPLPPEDIPVGQGAPREHCRCANESSSRTSEWIT